MGRPSPRRAGRLTGPSGPSGRSGLAGLTLDALEDLGELLAPRVCGACNREGAAPLCTDCLALSAPPAGPTCRRCGNGWQPDRLTTGVCGRCGRFGRPFAFETAVALWRYAGPVRALVQAFKFHGRGDCLAPLGRRLATEPRLAPLLRARRWVVVPLPARAASRRRRGYDQAQRLAEALASRARLACEPGALVRRGGRRARTAGPQAGAPLERRRAAMRAALRARTSRVAGRPVLLVDDVLSTGASADAAARALRLAGATGVSVVVLAT